MRKALLSTFAALGLAGCAISPGTENVTGLRAMDIGNKIRCEAAIAVRATVRGAVSRRAEGRPYDKAVEALLRSSASIRGIRWADLHPYTQRLIGYYNQTAVVYDFSLTITENNNVQAGIALTQPILRGTQVLGAGGHFNRARNTQTTFRLRDTFATLLRDFDDTRCDLTVAGPNYAYPIAGTIGILDQMTDFVNLNHFERLAPTDGATNNAFTRVYKFTTEVSGNVNPSMTLEPIGRVIQLTSITGKLDATRNDEHQVTVVFAVPPGGPDPFRSSQARIASAFDAADVALSRSIEREVIRGSARTGEALNRLARCGALLVPALCN